MPILSNLMLDVDADQLTITGADIDIRLILKVNIRNSEAGCTAIPANKLHNLFGEIDAEEVSFLTEDGHVKVSAGEGIFQLPTQPAEEFPESVNLEPTLKMNYNMSALLERIQQVSFAASEDEPHSRLRGVLFDIQRNGLRFVATDGRRLAIIGDKTFNFDSQQQIIIPIRAIDLLVNIGGGGDVEVAYLAPWLSLTWESKQLTCKTVAGVFPNYAGIIPQENGHTLTIERDLLIQALRRAKLFTSRENRVSMSIAHESVSVESGADKSGADEFIGAEFDGETLKLACNTNYIIEILAHIKSEQVIFKINDAVTGIIIEPVPQSTGIEQMSLLMPIRIE